ncbi:fungal-specific transcription factor domain-containing protein [Biscogniauxia mediterranea]|nr:fungal-specific transcription factor domain-containing protein [Biscogniauxia mediterranea]
MDPYKQQSDGYDPGALAGEYWELQYPQQLESDLNQQQKETMDRFGDLAQSGVTVPRQSYVPVAPMEPSSSSTEPPPLLPAFVGGADLPTGSAVGAGSASSQASQQREQMRAKRRVPQNQRRRAQMSCDGCKTKRCKCVRLWPGHGPGDEGAASGAAATTTSDELPPCKLCTETGIACVTSMPRKHRVYGSVEDLDKRYRALEALVTGVFPGLNTKSTAEELVTFGRGMGVSMPEFPQPPDATSSAQATTTLTSAQKLTATITATAISTSKTDQKPSSPEIQLARAAYLDNELPRAYTARGNASRDANALPRPATEALLGSEDESRGLVLDPSGWPHYVGPCGSFTFFRDVRELASRRSAAAAAKAGKPGTGQPVGVGAAGSSLAGSLGNVRYGRSAGGPGLSQTQSPMPRQGYLEGDSPPSLSDGGGAGTGAGGGLASSSSTGHPDDLDYRRYRRSVSTIALPPRDQADACMDAYFRHVHPNFILFHRGAFQRAYGALWRSREATTATATATARADVGEVSVSAGWLSCLYMMLVFGSRSLPQDGGSLAFQRRWFAEVDRLPPLSTSSLPNVCAYMLLSLYHHNTNDRTSAWTFHGAACRLAVAQGMHREKVARSFGDPTHENLRRRIWWTIYQYEQFLCCSLGRPSAINDREMDVGVPGDDFLEGNLLPADHLRYAVKLDMLHAAIRREIYDPVTNNNSNNSNVPSGSGSSSGSTGSKKCARALEFLLALAAWEEALPRRLRPVSAAHGLDGNENQWRSVHMLHIRQQDTLNFLTRPFLLRAVQRSQSRSRPRPRSDDAHGDTGDADAAIVARLGQVCVTTAMRCGESITELFRAGFLNGVTWLDVFFAYLSSVTISLALLSPPPPEHERVPPLFFGGLAGAAKAKARIGGDNNNNDDDDDNDDEKDEKVLPSANETTAAAESLVPWSRLIREYTRDEIAATGRQLYDVLTTVDMCGTSARYAKMSVDLARAVGIVDEEETSDLEGSSSLPADPDPGDMMMMMDLDQQGGDGGGGGGYPQFGGVEAGAAPPGQGAQGMAGTNIFPIPGPAEPSQFGRAFAGNLNFGISANTHWDMVLPPSQWNAVGSSMSMEFIWPGSNQDPWANPSQYPPPT